MATEDLSSPATTGSTLKKQEMEETNAEHRLCEQDRRSFRTAVEPDSKELAKSKVEYQELLDDSKFHEICDMPFEEKKKLMEKALGVLEAISGDDRWSDIVSAYMTALVRRMGKAGTSVPAYVVELMELEKEGLRSKWEQHWETWEQERDMWEQEREEELAKLKRQHEKELAKLKFQYEKELGKLESEHKEDRIALIQRIYKYKDNFVYCNCKPYAVDTCSSESGEICEAKSAEKREASGSPLKKESGKLKEEPKEKQKVICKSKVERTSHERERFEQVYDELHAKYNELDAKYNNMEKQAVATKMSWEKMVEELKASYNAEKEEWEQQCKMLVGECKENNELAKDLAKLKLEYEKDRKVLTQKILKYEGYLSEYYGCAGKKSKDI